MLVNAQAFGSFPKRAECWAGPELKRASLSKRLVQPLISSHNFSGKQPRPLWELDHDL